MIEVKVRLSVPLARLVGSTEITLTLLDGATVAILWEMLERRYNLSRYGVLTVVDGRSIWSYGTGWETRIYDGMIIDLLTSPMGG
ncbi:hypothetical protein V3F56_05520 [Moorellaceae bacterium AZ2]